MNKKQEYALVFFGLAAVVTAFFAILLSNYTLAIIGGALAVIAMVMTLWFVYIEEEEIRADRKEMAAERKRSEK